MNDSIKRVATITFLLGLASLASADVVLPKIIAGHAEEPLIVAHRGASRDAPENTIPAFQLAWEQGADAIEGDFHLSKDGEIVCFHDADTKRVAGTQLVVRQSTLAELKQLDVGATHGVAFNGTRIPTIAEVFATIPQGKKIFIEVKCGAEIIPTLLNEIDQSGLTQEQIVVISFNKQVIQQLKIKAPQYKASWLCSFNKQETGEITPSLATVLKTLKQIQADGLSSNTAVPASVIEAVSQQGYEWHVWTINDLKTARRMQALGVLSITTDVPGTMR
jgi:glycerophosphoryl diester phosphodiesterase|tara:strand:- start:613 stop:1443 length:831 start_codon:yes stop_codon:yes gene_type:complete